MPPRAAISNFAMTMVILFFMLMLGMLLKARYRLPSETKEGEMDVVPKAIPVAIPVEETVYETRAYKEGDWWVLPHPQIVVSRASEPDTLRIRSGPKEDVFSLYFIDAAEATWTRPRRLREQAEFFHKVSDDKVVEAGGKALNWVTDLLSKHPFTVYTKWGRVPETERYYAFVKVELEPGKPEDLGQLLVRHGYASPAGQQTRPMPESMPPVERYIATLGKAMALAKVDKSGLWKYTP
ncbi:MAG: hypothetical protein ACAI34_24745 [Verrucomicrobium sp.]|nr:hypothetical protein [Verrucomicrobium sp.]